MQSKHCMQISHVWGCQNLHTEAAKPNFTHCTRNVHLHCQLSFFALTKANWGGLAAFCKRQRRKIP